MSELGVMLGRCVTIVLNEKEYRLSPLTLKDMVEYEEHCQDIKLAEIKKLRTLGLVSEEKAQEMALEVIAAQKKPQEAQEASIAEVRFLIERSMSRGNPNLSHEEIDSLITSDNVQRFGEAIQQLTGSGGAGKNEETAKA